MGVMDLLTALIGITLPVLLTNWLTSRQTQRIIENSNRQTLKLLHEIKEIQQDTKCVLQKMHRCLLKLDFGFEANARMHGWSRADNVSPRQTRKLPEPRIYNEKLHICYFKSG